jgi:hypothetical protein
MREYFDSLSGSAHPESSDPRTRSISRFQELLLVSFREFSVITDETIQNERRKYRGEVIHGIESFAKRAAIRSLKGQGRFAKDQLGLIYDALFRAICIEPAVSEEKPLPVLLNLDGANEQKTETRVGLRTFRVFLSEIVTWARDEKIISNGFKVRMRMSIHSLRVIWMLVHRNALIVK